MIELGIDGKQYSLKTEIPNFNIKEGKELHNIIFNAPENLLALYNCSTDEEIDKIELTDEDTIKAFPEFYGKIISYCGDIPEEVMGKCLSEERIEIYKGYLESLILSLIHLPENVEQIEGFECEGDYYALPVSEEMLGEERIGAGMSAMEFAEETDLRFFQKGLEGGKYEYAANIISILCRPKGEKYDEKTSLDRVEMFMGLPLDIAHSVFFSLIVSMQKYNLSTISSLLPAELDRLKQLRDRT